MIGDPKIFSAGPASLSNGDVRIQIVLKGEEAREFERWVLRRNGKKSVVAKNLLVKGLISVGALPEWWERRGR